MIQAYRNHSIDWKPSAVVALATSVDESQVAAAREDGSLEIWLVSPGTVGWHCQMTIHGDTDSRVSSLAWCRAGSRGIPGGRLFSSSIDGTVSVWDLFHLKQKIVLESLAVSIWQIAVSPASNPIHTDHKYGNIANGHSSNKSIDVNDHENSQSDEDQESRESEDNRVELHERTDVENPCLALACDDGCVRIYSISDSDELVYKKSLPRVSGRVLSVTWGPDGNRIYSGSSDGFIRCWDAISAYEVYRITVGLGGSGSGLDICVWSLLVLRCGTLVSADSTGSVQFWDSQHGTLLHAHSFHKGDVNALAAAPSHSRVFSAGSDGQVILYKLSSNKDEVDNEESSVKVIKKWVYVGKVMAHTHDIRALTVAVPICREDALPGEHSKRIRRQEKPIEFSYHKWAHLGVPVLISAGDDTKLLAYSVKEFTKFSPHDICPAPQRLPIQIVLNTVFSQMSLLMVQASRSLDILCLHIKSGNIPNMGNPTGCHAATDLLARVKSKKNRRIVCSAISPSGTHFTYSDHVKPSLFELKRCEVGNSVWTIIRRSLPQILPFAHSMVFSPDSSRLIIAGHDRRIYIVEVGCSKLLHTFTPCHVESDEGLPPREPPITRMFSSYDGHWLAAVNCFGDIYVFNMEIQRQHWFISRLDGASVTAGGFPPWNNNVLILTTSSNHVYALDVEAKQLGECSTRHTFMLPRRYQEFPGEVIGLSFPPASSSSSVVVYSARAMCMIELGMPLDRDDDYDAKLRENTSINGKRKLIDIDINTKLKSRKSFEFCGFRDPVLFIGHLSKNSILIMDKPWLEVLKTFDAAPVHKHVYGT